jgi:hypothetical protein
MTFSINAKVLSNSSLHCCADNGATSAMIDPMIHRTIAGPAGLIVHPCQHSYCHLQPQASGQRRAPIDRRLPAGVERSSDRLAQTDAKIIHCLSGGTP